MTHSRIRTRVTLSLIVLSLLTFPAFAQSMKSVELNSVIYPERQKTTIAFLTMRAAPVASLSAEIEAAQGQTSIEISFSGMKPAILFGGNVTSYVVWVVTRDGAAENVGELWVRDAKGSFKFRTAQRDFAMMITAESYPLANRPSPLVAFISAPATTGRTTNTSFVFTNFGEAVIPANDSIATLNYTDKAPIDLVQAEKVFAMAEASGAADYDPQSMDQARITLAQARNLAKAGDRTVHDYARRTVALASQALREMDNQIAGAAAAAAEARRLAELEAAQSETERIAQQLEIVRLQREALNGEMKRATARANATAAALTEVEKQRAIMAEERDTLAAERDVIALERDTLTIQRDAVAKERDQAAKERDEITIQRDALTKELDQLAKERDAITAERDALAIERDQVAKERDAITAERDALAIQRDEVAKERDEVTAQRDTIASERDGLAVERDEIARERDEIAKQKAALEQRLSGALDKVAATTNTARGLVVNLSGILFDLNKATLQRDAQLTVAKLSGVLLMMPDVNVRVEGHTDSTGSDALNEKLSKERAKTVYDLLLAQGIAAERMVYEGYGPRIPVATNDTADGRALNRRVEVVLKEGKIEGADAPVPPSNE